MAHNTLLCHIYFNEHLHVYRSYRNLQLVSVISKEVIPNEFYSRKLTIPQKRYTVMEK